MAYDTIAAANGTIEVTLGGEAYPVRTLKVREWAPVQAWIVKNYPSPLVRAGLALKQAKALGTPLDADAEDALLSHAQREQLSWPPQIGSREWNEALDASTGGLVQFLHTVLSVANPDFTRDQAEALAPRTVGPEIATLYSWAVAGQRPDQAVPKDQGLATRPTGPAGRAGVSP